MIFNFLVNLLIANFLLTSVGLSAGAANQLVKTGIGGDSQVVTAPMKISANHSLGIKTTARSAIVIDQVSGEILWQKNARQIMSIASITKLMSALVFLRQQLDFDQEFIYQAQDNRSGSRLAVYPGDKITLRDLFYGSLLGSANNATMALARSTGLTEEEFVGQMNKIAKELGLVETFFVEPTGLKVGNQSTAFELAQLLMVAEQYPKIVQALASSEYRFSILNTGRTVRVKNTNKLLKSFFKSVIGKTGFIDEAGYCFVAKIIGENNQPIITVVLGSASEADRFQEVKGLAWWAMENYYWP